VSLPPVGLKFLVLQPLLVQTTEFSTKEGPFYRFTQRNVNMYPFIVNKFRWEEESYLAWKWGMGDFDYFSLTKG
jgi:hypothetical protein